MNISHTTARMWRAAVDLAAAVHADWAAVTGRRWRRPVEECPTWCGRGHLCTAHTMPAGQHRSEPATFTTGYGSLVATRTASRSGVNQVEIRTVIGLPHDDDRATRTAQGLLTAIHLTVTALDVPAERLMPVAPYAAGARLAVEGVKR
jgi:hypothetical protein